MQTRPRRLRPADRRSRREREGRDFCGWHPSDYTSGPLEGIPCLVILPSTLLRRCGAHVISQLGDALVTLHAIAAGRPLLSRGEPQSFSARELNEMTAEEFRSELCHRLADDTPQERERIEAAREELEAIDRQLRTAPAMYRNRRVALFDEWLRRHGIGAKERRRIVSTELGISIGILPMAISRGRDELGLPSRQIRAK